MGGGVPSSTSKSAQDEFTLVTSPATATITVMLMGYRATNLVGNNNSLSSIFTIVGSLGVPADTFKKLSFGGGGIAEGVSIRRV